MTSLRALNKPEPKAKRLRRLLTVATRRKYQPISVADALEFRREEYGLTAREFSAIIGVAFTHYSEVIHGKRQLPINATRRAYAIGVPADILLQLLDATRRED